MNRRYEERIPRKENRSEMTFKRLRKGQGVELNESSSETFAKIV